MKSPWFYVVSFFSGLVFAGGLAISGMTQPAKVLGFLDVTGAWDPTLVFVMAAAIAVHMGFALRARRAVRPLLAAEFSAPARDATDASLFVGAAVFGVGWGLEGFCPGPAIVASASGAPVPLVFVGSMTAGLFVPQLVRSLRQRRRDGQHRPRRRLEA